ncbi:Rz1-like lysis system protein LysC [Bordetella bronchiseptica]|uniref:Rz1-like lysis system protein LysC n=1 Tax=Bordetella bronchiseptica TaxID=518 RepID=UPI003994A221
MPCKRILTGLAAACLMLYLTACSAPVPLAPPAEYLEDCPHAEPPKERTNAGLSDAVRRGREALDRCNADKEALRAWAGG